MSTYDRCKKCGDWDYIESHKCDPAWEVYLPDYFSESEIEMSHGIDAEETALNYVEREHSDMEYPTEVEIWVRKDENEPWQIFDITVETVPSFSATKRDSEG